MELDRSKVEECFQVLALEVWHDVFRAEFFWRIAATQLLSRVWLPLQVPARRTGEFLKRPTKHASMQAWLAAKEQQRAGCDMMIQDWTSSGESLTYLISSGWDNIC